ncbi:MAG: metallophosphoesterase [Prevotella sp.]|nr:metallophosphoesterase [Prevotella sp.]
MRNRWMNVVAVAWMAGISLTVSAQQLSLSGDKVSFKPGETIGINYEGADSGDKILLYHNLAMVPLKEKGVTNGDAGLYEVAKPLQAGDYNAILVGKEGEEKARVAFAVEEEPLPSEGHRIFAISDIHVMSPDLVFDPTNSLYVKDMAESRKLQAESYEIFCAYVDTIKALRPELVVIPGDLTKDGEQLSHQMVAAKLQELLDMGIPTLVIPGNHDMENDNGRLYTATGRQKLERFTPEQFEQIYYNFGLKDAIDRDPISLSYVCEPIEGLRFIGIDDCRIPSRGDTKYGDGEYGRIRPATLEWVLAQADRAKEENKVVVAAVHHQLMYHYNGQERVMPSAATENGDSIARLFADHGIRMVLTGHMHMPNVSRMVGFEGTDTITEVNLASTICYPSQYALLTINDNLSTMRMDTRALKSTQNLPHVQLAARMKVDDNLDNSISSLTMGYMSTFNSMLKDYASIPEFAGIIDDVPTDANELAAIAIESFGGTLRKVFFTASEGNEHLKDAVDVVLNELEEDCDKACSLIFDQQNESTRSFLSYAMYGYMMEMGEDIVKSMLSDTSHLGTPLADQTDDLYLSIALKEVDSGIVETVTTSQETACRVYDIAGKVVNINGKLPKGVYVVKTGDKVKKVLVK